MKVFVIAVTLAALCLICLGSSIQAQTTSFVYQGKLSNGTPQTGQFDFTFKLFTAQAPGGTQVGTTQQADNITATNGVFKVNLDFGSAPFTANSANFMEIAVRPSGTSSYATLLPRQAITNTPYAIESQSALTAANASKLGGVTADQYLTAANAGNTFVQNTTSPQASNFNITGNGTVGGTLTAKNINVIDSSNSGLRVQTNAVGGTVASFGGLGDFEIDAAGSAGGRLTVSEAGNVGIGYPNPNSASKLTVAGTIESRSGGFKFPDGSVQTTAAVTASGAANAVYTIIASPSALISNDYSAGVDIRHLTLPAGLYSIEATAQFQLVTVAVLQTIPTPQVIECRVTGDPLSYASNMGGYITLTTLAGVSVINNTMTVHSLVNIPAGNVGLQCRAPYSDVIANNIFVINIRITAVRQTGALFVQ